MTISVQNLSFSYDKKTPVLEDINFSVEKGKFVGIFGPNGGGKTTLLMLILGLLTPTAGRLEIQGKIGYVPQVRRFDRQFPISVLKWSCKGAWLIIGAGGVSPLKRKNKLMKL